MMSQSTIRDIVDKLQIFLLITVCIGMKGYKHKSTLYHIMSIGLSKTIQIMKNLHGLMSGAFLSLALTMNFLI